MLLNENTMYSLDGKYILKSSGVRCNSIHDRIVASLNKRRILSKFIDNANNTIGDSNQKGKGKE